MKVSNFYGEILVSTTSAQHLQRLSTKTVSLEEKDTTTINNINHSKLSLLQNQSKSLKA